MVAVAQRTCGAGRLIRTRFLGRSYTFEGKNRGYDANRGVDAGTPLSVWGFGATINTDRSTTAHNKGLLCHPNYSDDRNITGSGSYIKSGLFQEGLSCGKDYSAKNGVCLWEERLRGRGDTPVQCAYCYSKRDGLEFHEQGKKGPEALCFTQKVKRVLTTIPDEVETLKLGPVNIPTVDRQRVLGLNIATVPKTMDRDPRKSKLERSVAEFTDATTQKAYVNQSHKIIDKYGYFLEPNISSFRSMAYRFQALKDEQTPKRIWQAEMSYFVGKLRFGAAFYFCRSTSKQIDTIRFYYGMAVSAIMGLTAYETLGASCCKRCSVAEGCDSMTKLLKLSGMPTIREIASQDAQTFIRQTQQIKPKWFLPKNSRLASKEMEREKECKTKKMNYFPKYCSEVRRDTLVYDCWNLAKQYNMKEQEQSKCKDSASQYRLPKRLELPYIISNSQSDESRGKFKVTGGLQRRVSGMARFEQFWEVSCEIVKSQMGDLKNRYIRDTFKLMCLNELSILEQNDRQHGFRTPSKPLNVDKRCSTYPPDRTDIPMDKLTPAIQFNCTKPAPQLYRSKVYTENEKHDIFPCLICGNLTRRVSGVACWNKCGDNRIAHTWCVKKLGIKAMEFKCNKINEHLIPAVLGKRKVERRPSLAVLSEPARFSCLICGDPVAEWEPEFRGKREFWHSDIVKCKYYDDERPCRFAAHLRCAETHDKHFSTNRSFRRGEFACNNVEVHLSPKTVDHLNRHTPTTIAQKIRSLKLTNRIRPNIDKRKRRFTNPNNMCHLCGEEVPRTQKHHLYQHCSAIAATPTTCGPKIDLRAAGKRCLAIVIARENTSKSPTRNKKRKWGEDDGESVAEMTPKRKRRRPQVQNKHLDPFSKGPSQPTRTRPADWGSQDGESLSELTPKRKRVRRKL